MKTLSTLVVVAATLATTGMASAVERDVAPIQIELGDAEWILVPTMADGSLESFVGLRANTTVGENITTVWFRRTTAQEWESWAWSEQDQSKAIASVKTILQLPDSSDSKWPIAPSADVSAAPEQLEKGVLESDPFASILSEMEDPEPLVQTLESGGWKAAWIGALMTSDDCEETLILDAMAAGVELQLNQEGDGEAAAFQQLQLACITFCIRWTWYGTPTPRTAWACGPWGPDPAFAGPIPNGPCSDICHYVRTTTRSQTRTATRRNWNCTRVTWTQTRTQTGTQTGRCDIDLSGAGCVHGTLPCPAAPCNQSSSTCAPTTGVSTSGWTQ